MVQGRIVCISFSFPARLLHVNSITYDDWMHSYWPSRWTSTYSNWACTQIHTLSRSDSLPLWHKVDFTGKPRYAATAWQQGLRRVILHIPGSKCIPRPTCWGNESLTKFDQPDCILYVWYSNIYLYPKHLVVMPWPWPPYLIKGCGTYLHRSAWDALVNCISHVESCGSCQGQSVPFMNLSGASPDSCVWGFWLYRYGIIWSCILRDILLMLGPWLSGCRWIDCLLLESHGCLYIPTNTTW